MLYMVVERYLRGPEPVRARVEAKGRMLPDGLRYVDSWVVDDVAMDRCFQLMEADGPEGRQPIPTPIPAAFGRARRAGVPPWGCGGHPMPHSLHQLARSDRPVCHRSPAA